MSYKANTALCSEMRTEQWAQSERHVEFFYFKFGGT
jgi:hypothetical protein